jgi:hypothetical protein
MKGWAIAIRSDLVAILLVAAAVLLILAITGMLLATRARRRREWQSTKEVPASLTEVSIAHSAGRHLVDRLSELQGRLAAMAEDIGQLTVQARRVDELHAANLRLTEQNETLLADFDQLRSVIVRIGEVLQRASTGQK